MSLRTCEDTAAAAGILMRLFRGPATVEEIIAFSHDGERVPLDRRRVTITLLEMFDVLDRRTADQEELYALNDLGIRELARLRRPLSVMREVSRDLVAILEPHAARLEVAGSIRRECQDCGDVELVALVEGEPDLFGDRTEVADPAPAVALRAASHHTVRSGPRYTQTLYVHQDHGPVTVDLFVTQDPACWGRLFFVRTGSADFVRRADRHFQKAGGSIAQLRYYDAEGKALDTPAEADVWKQLKCSPVPPPRRGPRPSRTA